MSGFAPLSLLLILWVGQGDNPPPYVREGNRVELEFQSYQTRLRQFSSAFRSLVMRETPWMLSQFLDAPVKRLVYGYQMLPQITDALPANTDQPISSFSYSWPTTEGYIVGESVQLGRAEEDLRAVELADNTARPELIAKLLRDYRELAANQRLIDQYLQYNRYWQRSIAQDRPRFDQLTKMYNLIKEGELETVQAIRALLDHPEVPSFLQITKPEPDRIVLRVPVYTDIGDEAFLASAKTAIEGMWRTRDGNTTYALEIQLRRVAVAALYPGEPAPKPGDPLEIWAHAARFPPDGAVLTTGAETTHGLVGRYVTLGAGDLSARTLAHEFGHVLGFRDGYIRGYRDLKDHGFEILELTSSFDDIMSAPREGHVQTAHFKMLIQEMKQHCASSDSMSGICKDY